MQLAELKNKILSIPGKRTRTELVGKLKQYSDKMQKASDKLRRSSEGKIHSKFVFPDGDFDLVSEKIINSVRIAKNVIKKLSNNMNDIEKKSTDKNIADISDFADSSQKALKDKWKQLVSNKIQGYENILKAAKEARLEGSDILETFLFNLKERANTPPFTRAESEKIKSEIDGLINGVSHLGLEGETGKFLIAAAQGKGDPRSLENAEVRQFIERNDLWRLLRVKLG